MSPSEVWLAGGVRTPFSRFGGALRDLSSIDLAAFVIKEVLERYDIPGHGVDEVYVGVVMQGEAALNDGIIARQAVLKAGLAPTTVSLTIDRACCSSLTAVQLGARSIRLGEADVVVCAGADNMGRSPLLQPANRFGQVKVADMTMKDPLYKLGYREYNPNAVDAGEVALEHGVSRQEQDAWALRSQQRYQAAKASGKFSDEMVSVPYLLPEDEFPKPNTSLEKLSQLPTVYDSPTVTAGNAPGLDTGASAVVLLSDRARQRYRIKPLAKILSVASVALAPREIACAPAPALRKALDQARVALDDIDLIEINEAFAAMPLVATKLLAEGDPERTQALREKVNVNGGAVAIGHPVGASGARLLMTLAYELERRGGGKGACAICGGLAQGDAAIIEVPAKKRKGGRADVPGRAGPGR